MFVAIDAIDVVATAAAAAIACSPANARDEQQ